MKLQAELYQPTIGCVGIANPVEILHRFPMPGQMLTAEMSPREGALAAQWLGLGTVLPCHYINPDCEEVREFEQHLAKARSRGERVPECKVLQPGEALQIVATGKAMKPERPIR
jgi:L-ascorbate metabolism protein UlaG (beta-lactamase superfamily)